MKKQLVYLEEHEILLNVKTKEVQELGLDTYPGINIIFGLSHFLSQNLVLYLKKG